MTHKLLTAIGLLLGGGAVMVLAALIFRWFERD